MNEVFMVAEMEAIAWAQQHEFLNCLVTATAEDLTFNSIGLHLDSDLLYIVPTPQGDSPAMGE